MSAVTDTTPRVHRLTRARYEQMVDAGIFGPEDRIELLDGDLIERAPQKSKHATTIRLFEQELARVFSEGFDVRAQLPLALGPHSEPEPDLAVVAGSPRDYRDAHPQSALLVVEIAETTLSYDRGRKLAAYARAGIADYWVVDLAGGTIEVCRRPEGDRYLDRDTRRGGESVAPLAAPQASIRVDDLLP